jgi:phage terminase large subunit-like protein
MTKTNPATKYIDSLTAGSVIASKEVIKACKRHLQDLDDGHERGLVFRPEKGLEIIRFVEQFCHHSQGKWAGQKVKLEPWQRAMLWILYGWYRTDGTRRFRYAYIELAKGNGKSFLASALALYEMMFSDPGAEVYSVATTKDQAKIVFSEAERMVAQSPFLKQKIHSFRNNLHIKGTATKFQPLSSDSNTLDGLRPQCFVIDELHKWGFGARELWDTLANALGKRESPLLLVITTAGSDKQSVCWQQHEYVCKVLDGVLDDDTWFGWVCCLDDNDDYEDPKNWIKSNPNLGVSVKATELEDAIRKAKGDPASLNGVLRLRLGIWTQAQTVWMPREAWDACNEPVDPEALKGRPCFAGLDLSSTTDTTAFVLLFPPYGNDKLWRVLPYFFLPEEGIEKRSKVDRVPYDLWKKQGYFELTPGNVVDYDYLRTKINMLAKDFDIREIVFDRWNAQGLITDLQEDGFTMVRLGQGYESLNAPMMNLMTLVKKKELAHGNHPVLRWQSSNVMAAMDPAGNIKPDKAKSRERIDGIAALIDGLARAMVVPIKPKRSGFAPFII